MFKEIKHKIHNACIRLETKQEQSGSSRTEKFQI